MSLGGIIIIGSGSVAASIQYIITFVVNYVPQRVTVIGINASPLFEVPSVDILSHLNLLVNRRSLLEDFSTFACFFVITGQISYTVLVETDIETDIPAPLTDVDYICINVDGYGSNDRPC